MWVVRVNLRAIAYSFSSQPRPKLKQRAMKRRQMNLAFCATTSANDGAKHYLRDPSPVYGALFCSSAIYRGAGLFLIPGL